MLRPDSMFISDLARERQRALLAEAEHDRLARMARVSANGPTSASTLRMLVTVMLVIVWRSLRRAISHVPAPRYAERVKSPVPARSTMEAANN